MGGLGTIFLSQGCFHMLASLRIVVDDGHLCKSLLTEKHKIFRGALGRARSSAQSVSAVTQWWASRLLVPAL